MRNSTWTPEVGKITAPLKHNPKDYYSTYFGGPGSKPKTPIILHTLEQVQKVELEVARKVQGVEFQALIRGFRASQSNGSGFGG